MFKLNILAFLLVVIISTVFSAIDVEIENKNIDRTIDLTSQLVKVSYKITLEHKSKKAITNYLFLIPSVDCDKLSYVSARDSAKKELKLTLSKTAEECSYSMTLPNSQIPNPVIYIETIFSKALQPYPTEITQAERQLVRYFGNAVFYSPFKTSSQKTTIHLASRNVESFTQVKPSVHSDTQIVYGPYENIPAKTQNEIVVHYENNSPFMVVTRLERTIEVSHWGNVAVEETIDILHSGALLKGSFSRYDYQKDSRSGPASVKSYKTILPASATGVYYRDTNGNISTSAMVTLKDSVELDLRPRFPLFGGWRTHYTIGYNVPSFEYLFHNGDSYMLKMRLIDHVFDDMIVDELVTKIILPEGTKNLKLITPYSVERQPDTLHFTYLDITGRPVITFRKTNLVENHINDFNIKYNFSRIMMLQEPLLVVVFLYLFFLFVIIWMRLDFSIIKERERLHKD
ncbi:CLUMA_CG016408, isoform A [Clunio marinus]|uniref:Dolichyl-diphosphooligosaccharide--protein glycosyltransferase subunit 1 n=1 Tax=Clunio marinus TaxID=568069 RepID=A0A1J1IUI7_9DIPT|nr:CLUMA_CG016408, isoform A [Clunio marinus]